jgi:hypothetical protein
MKNIIKWYLALVALSMVCVHCTEYDDYKKYLEGGEIIYPQKVDSVKTYPGNHRILLEWVIVDPKVTSCKILYSQSGEKDSLIVPIDSKGGAEDDTTRLIIDNLAEATYTFWITSYDKYEHRSITVETEESSYGDMYEDALVNRVLKSKRMDKEGLKLEWYSGDDSELSVELNYTSQSGSPKVLYMADSVTTTLIPDFSVAYPFTYRTLYLPTETAIDTFYSSTLEDKIEFQTELLNTVAPFAITGRGWWVQGRFGTPTNWIINSAAAQNGNVDNAYGNALSMWAWSGYSPAGSFTNGKIYQTILLGAGTYSFRARVEDISDGISKNYLVAVADYELPDIGNVEREALSFLAIPKAAKNTILETSFTLNFPTVVSLGYVANIDHAKQVMFNKFELVKN